MLLEAGAQARQACAAHPPPLDCLGLVVHADNDR